jgi:hypothetical protein
MTQLLKIRFFQLKRDLGFLFFVIIALASCISFLVFNHQKQVGFYAAGIVVYLFYNFHKNRRDIAFMAKHFEKAKSQILVEYQLFLLPVSIPCLFTNYWYCFFILHLFVCIVPFLNIKSKYDFKFSFITRFFKDDYIFISGVRRNLVLLIIFFLLALALSPLKLFPLVALFLFNNVMFSFYEANESVQMLQASQKTPKQLMASLLNSGVKKIVLVNFPILLINSIFNPDLWMFNMYFFAYNVLILASVIALKYESYQFKTPSSNHQIKLIVMILGLFIPYLFPLAIIFYAQSRAGAIKNLSHYLDVVN